MIEIPYERINLEWKSISGFEDQYEVSNYGDFHVLPYEFIDKANRHITRQEKYYWSEELSECGGDKLQGQYLGIHLGGMKKTYAHILAAKEFCPNPDNKPEVNHKDGNTKHNYCGCQEHNYEDSNLEWVTRKENMEHASANGLINHESCLRKLQCKLNREKVNYDLIKRPIIQINPTNGSIIREYESIAEASKITDIQYTTIRAVANRQGYHKTAGGYNWVYKKEYDATLDYSIIVDKGSGSRKRVAKLTPDNQIIDIYTSIKEAGMMNNYPSSNYIGEVCNGRRLMYKGYKWQFID